MGDISAIFALASELDLIPHSLSSSYEPGAGLCSFSADGTRICSESVIECVSDREIISNKQDNCG